ncbi:MAG: ABC transporter ATP-binding protein [Kiloniellales bacterium]|nr:ABC transporter ATP-binding protein [Kiloniellales bacterium]
MNDSQGMEGSGHSGGAADGPARLAVRELFKAYRLGEAQVAVLRGLSIAVAGGEIVAIMGPSGSGKTTLLNCIAGIDSPDRGSVSIADRPVDFGSERERTLLRRHHIGIVFQFFNLIPTLNVRENVELPLRIAGQTDAEGDARVDRLLQRLGLGKRAGHAPSQLSGGEMQLVSIARALVHRPQVLLADEPTGNVNPAIGASIMASLREAAKDQGTGVLLVTHSPEHAAWADRICFLKDGVIAEEMRQDGERSDPTPLYRRLERLGI